MGSGVSRKRCISEVTPCSAYADTSGVCLQDGHASVDVTRFISHDQEIVHSGEVWKLNSHADPGAVSEWLLRRMWLTNVGGLFYYSPQYCKPMGCHLGRLSVRIPEGQMLGRFPIELHVDESLGVKVQPTVLAATTKAERDMWVQCLQTVQQMERSRGEDSIDPLAPFVGPGMHHNRMRMNHSDSRRASGELKTSLSDSAAREESGKNIEPGGWERSHSMRRTNSYGDQIMSQVSGMVDSKFNRQGSCGTGVFSCAGYDALSRHLGHPNGKLRYPVRRNSQASFSEKLQTVLILDWDDTLFPTTFVRKDCGLDWRYPIAEQVRPGPGRTQVEQLLDRLSHKVEAFVKAACSVAHVVIVTLATWPWVSTSARNFMPRLERLINEHKIRVVYARERISETMQQEYAAQTFKTSHDEAAHWMRAKAVSMQQEFESLYGGGSSWKNVISIGDSDFERVALATITKEHFMEKSKGSQIVETGHTNMFISEDGHLQRLRAKSVKMLDEPSCEELIAQATLFESWLPHLVKKDSGFDIDLVGSADDRHLSEVNSFVTGKKEKLRWMALAGMA